MLLSLPRLTRRRVSVHSRQEGDVLSHLLLTREDCFSQGSKLPQRERAAIQAFTGYGVAIKREDPRITTYTGRTKGEDTPFSYAEAVRG